MLTEFQSPTGRHRPCDNTTDTTGLDSSAFQSPTGRHRPCDKEFWLDTVVPADFNPQRDATALATNIIGLIPGMEVKFQSPTGRHRPCDTTIVTRKKKKPLISIPNGTPPPLRLVRHTSHRSTDRIFQSPTGRHRPCDA